MRASVLAALLFSLGACTNRHPALYSAGSTADDGHGELARASAQFLTEEPISELPAGSQPAVRRADAASGATGAAPGPASASEVVAGFGSDAYGGASYAAYIVPAWPPQHVDRRPKYSPSEELSGAIEGVISWRGSLPAALSTSCGPITPVAVGDKRALSNVLVFIERVRIGRTLPNDGKPASVGGLVVKRGCSLAPPVQIATPLPASIQIAGDSRHTKLRVTPPTGSARSYKLQAAGRLALPVEPGVTRIDADDGTFSSAWIIALDTPYYALTDERGRFRLDELAPGTYAVTIWHPPLPMLANGLLSYGPPLVAQRTVRVTASKASRLDIALGR